MSPREYRDRLAFEHELINRRLTRFLASQTLLFAAYGFALKDDATGGKALFLKAVPASGASIASLIFVGVVAGLLAKIFVWKVSLGERADRGNQALRLASSESD